MTNLLEENGPSVEPVGPELAGRRPSTGAPRRLIGAALGLALLVVFVGRADDFLPNWDNPLRQETVARSAPPLLLALDDLDEYHAATGSFQVVIDREQDTRFLPALISGERVIFLATGTVDAYVDFSNLGPDQVQVSRDRRAATITLPEARLGQVTVDPSASRVLDHERGAVERIGDALREDPSVEGQLFAIGERKLLAAAELSDLQRRAQSNTRQMLTALAGSLGFDRVRVIFAGTT